MAISDLGGVLDTVASRWKSALGQTKTKQQQPVIETALGAMPGANPWLASLAGQLSANGSGPTSYTPRRRTQISSREPYGSQQLDMQLWSKGPYSQAMNGSTSFLAGPYSGLLKSGIGNPGMSLAKSAEQAQLAKAGLLLGGVPLGGDASAAGDLSGVLQWRSQMEKASRETGVPWEILGAIMGIESGGNPNSTSVAGAQGLMQVMPDIWGDLARNYGGNLYDPWTNIRTAAQILKDNYTRYGDWSKAANAYFGWGESDAYGTTGSQYVKKFNDNWAKLLQMGSNVVDDVVGDSLGRIGSWATSAITTAKQFLGQPYVWGGENPNEGFDCSGLTQWSFGQAGITLPRTAQAQWDATRRTNAPQVGDLVFFHSTYATNEYITHVGIYLGNGMMLHSGGSQGVGIADLNTPYYRQHFAGYGTVR